MSTENNVGVALTKEACPICAELSDGGLVINTRLDKSTKDKVESLHGQCIGFADKPCEECEKYMKHGIIVITIDESKTEDMNNPYRTGGFFVVTPNSISEYFDDISKEILEKRVCFMEHQVAKNIGLFGIKL